jgi:hypothetical protein
MGSPISSLVAGHFFQYFEHLLIKHNIDNKSVLRNILYVDDINYL